MNKDEKINLITSHLILEKQKSELELERFLNSDISINELCGNISNKINDYRNSISNISVWVEFIGTEDTLNGDNK